MRFLVGLELEMKKRIFAFCGFAALLIIEIIIGAFCGGFIRAYLGDILVIPLIYCFVRIFYTRNNKFLPLAVGMLGIFAEIIQYFNFCEIFGVDKDSLLGIMLGSVADIKDVLCYLAGVILIYLAEFSLQRFFDKDSIKVK